MGAPAPQVIPTDPPVVTKLSVTPVSGATDVVANVSPTFEFRITNVLYNVQSVSHPVVAYSCSGRTIDVGVASSQFGDREIFMLQTATVVAVVGDVCTASVDFDTTGPAGTVHTKASTSFTVAFPRPECVAPAIHNEKFDICLYPIGDWSVGNAQLPNGCAFFFASGSCLKDAAKFVSTGIVINSRPTMAALYQTTNPIDGGPRWGLSLLYADNLWSVEIASNGTALSFGNSPTEITSVKGMPDSVVAKIAGKCTKLIWGATGFVSGGDVGC